MMMMTVIMSHHRPCKGNPVQMNLVCLYLPHDFVQKHVLVVICYGVSLCLQCSVC